MTKPLKTSVFDPENEDNAHVMQEFGISLNLNLATCWLTLCVFEEVKRHCDLVMKLEMFNMKLGEFKLC